MIEPPGPTFLDYSPDGTKLLVSGGANFVRSFRTGDQGEPDIFDNTQEDSAGIIAGVGAAREQSSPDG